MATNTQPAGVPNDLGLHVPIPNITSGTGELTPSEMVAINYKYAKYYREGNFDALMNECMVDVPVYEYFPNRIRLTGKLALRRNFEVKHKGFVDIIDQGRPEVRYCTFGENCYAAEFSIAMPMPDGTRMRWHKFALIPFRQRRMVGEIVYNDSFFAERLEKMMTQDFLSTPGVERF
ncbi:MAG TPA: hypothetical protein VJQ47_05315 [Steroidobacteraceae bacterium]|nr:hypothetical protein [Steroidobacteraceae bacterium]